MAYKNKEKRAAYMNAWREDNKERRAATDKAWYEDNKGRKAAANKAYWEANKEEKAAYDKVYYEANKGRKSATNKAWYEDNKERRAATNKAYCEANPGYIAAKSARRRALQLKLIPAHLKDCPVEKRRVLDIYKLSNLISKATGIEHHVDHMWPLSDGGPEWSGNMQIITARENLTKNASVDLEVKHNIQQALNETVADKFQVA
jgi:5-methylcytosine-specific restriction endonuclease McrA